MLAYPSAELLVLGCKVGGRWNATALQLVQLLAGLKVQFEHPLLRKSAQLAWEDCWWALLSTAVQNACAGSLLAFSGKNLSLDVRTGEDVSLDVLLGDQHWE